MRSQIENYRAKAKKFARLAAVAKSLRHSRQYRKLAEMYWALALGEEPDRAQPSNERPKEHDMTTYPIEFHRRLEQKWAGRIEQILSVTGTAPPPRDPANYDDKDEDERAKRTSAGACRWTANHEYAL